MKDPKTKAKNLSCRHLWTVAFLEGKDDDALVSRNLQGPMQYVSQTSEYHDKKVVVVMPCDMSTHKSITGHTGIMCFRCGEDHKNLRTMFEVIEVKGQSLKDIALARQCFASDLKFINTGQSVSISFPFTLVLEGALTGCFGCTKEPLFSAMTDNEERVGGLTFDNLETPFSGKVRVFKLYTLKNLRSTGCSAENIPDLKFFPCETHGIMRGAEALTKAVLPTVFSEKDCGTLNARLEQLNIGFDLSIHRFFCKPNNQGNHRYRFKKNTGSNAWVTVSFTGLLAKQFTQHHETIFKGYSDPYLACWKVSFS